MVPSGYEDGTLGSLKPLDGTGDFTFTRGSDISATRVNEDGYIEKGYENLLLQSNSFDTTWVKSNASVTSGQAGYDGTNDAWLLSKSAANGMEYQSISSSGVQTISIYAKKGANSWMQIYAVGSTNVRTYYDLENGVLGAYALNIIDRKIEDVGNGWYRCSVTFNSSITNVRIFVSDGNNDDTGTSGTIYVQDAMLNQGLVAYPYVETTTAPVAGGILEDMPRLDYSGSCPALLLEPQRTNVVPQSEYFAGAWFTNATLTSNYGISPEGVRNSTRVNYSGASQYLAIGFQGAAGTGSVYVKGVIGETITIGAGGAGGGSLHTLNGEWQRVSFYDNGTSSFFTINTYNNASARDIEVFGAQIEQDATYPTSYIPTYGTSQTRLVEKLADGIDIGSFTSNYNTLFFDWGDMEDKSTFNKEIVRGWSSTDNTTNSFRIVSLTDGRSRYQVYTSAGNSVSYDYTHTTRDKIALVLNGLNSKLFVNGSLVNTYGIDVSQGLRQFNYNGFSRNVTNQFTIFPTALSDDECIALTTIS